MKRIKSTIASLICASLMVPALPFAQASAAPLGKPTITIGDSYVTHVGRGGRGWGPGPGAIIGGIIAGTLIAAAISEGRAHEDDIARCEYEFRSFDRHTGTYINRYGEERICPYLR
ncbi:MAG TPA: BA14K family protein [Hyphomicrobium sp.]